VNYFTHRAKTFVAIAAIHRGVKKIVDKNTVTFKKQKTSTIRALLV
jgi:hypothetical protein